MTQINNHCSECLEIFGPAPDFDTKMPRKLHRLRDNMAERRSWHFCGVRAVLLSFLKDATEIDEERPGLFIAGEPAG